MKTSYETLQIDYRNDIAIVQVAERRIFLTITETFRKEMVTFLESAPDKVIIDLHNVNVMNSSGLGVLILTRDRMKKREGSLVVCGLQPLMREIFSRMHLDSFFTILPDTETAREQLQAV